jgi:hypothetical protein
LKTDKIKDMLFKKSKQKPEHFPEWFIRLSEKEKEIALRVSLWLQERAGRLSATRLKIWCVIFFVLMTAVYATIGWFAFHGESGMRITFPLNVPAHPAMPVRPGVSRIHKKPKITHYLDSLLNDSSGRKSYDSVLQFRPGLMDTLLKINLNPY